MGGFECSSHRNSRGKRLDLIASTRHDEFARQDYQRMMDIGMRTCRDGLRWHLIEREPGNFDFTSLRKQVDAAKATGIEVIWDYFHYGFPDDLDIFSNEFVDRFVNFSQAATNYLISELGPDLKVCPVNEISFFAWIAGQVGVFYPGAKQRGNALKVQLVKCAIESIKAINAQCPAVRTILTEPAIHVVTKSDSPAARRAAENYRRSQFQGFDMVSGRSAPELGGSSKLLDIVGLNYYFHNQWHHSNRRKIPPGHKLYRPLHQILLEFQQRYDRPIMIAETGIEDDERPEWFRYVSSEVATAIDAGVDVRGVCLYPIVNHPGWADNRHCHNGLWDYADDNGGREIYEPLAEEIREQLACTTT